MKNILKGEKEIYEPLGRLTIAFSDLEQKMRFLVSKLLHVEMETAECVLNQTELCT